MDSKETAQMMLNTILEVKDTVSKLNERSKNYYDMLHDQDKKIQDNGTQIKDITHRVEKIEIALANIEIIKEHSQKIEEINSDLTILKRDRWWIGTLSGVVGSIIGFLLHFLFMK